MTIKKEKKKNILKWILVFLFILSIIIMCPLTGDDWGLGTKYSNLFAAFKLAIGYWKTFNGRVLGSMFVYFMNAHPLLRYFSETAIIFLTIYFLTKFKQDKNSKTFLIVLLLFLGISPMMFREVIAWESGFWNFAVPPLMSVIYLYYVKDIFFKKNVKFKMNHIIISFLCGFFMNLFIEHSSIFSVILGIGIIIFIFFLFRKVYNIEISFLIGAIIGCSLMFLSPMYRADTIRGAEWFKELNIFGKIIYNLKSSTWLGDILFNNKVLMILLCYIFLKDFKKEKRPYKIFTIIVVLITTYNLIFNTVKLNSLMFYNKIKLLLLIIYGICIISILFIKYYKRNNKKFWWLLGILISAVMVALPLLAAFGIGPRCFYNSYVLYIIFVIYYIEDLKFDSFKFVIIDIGLALVLLFIVISNFIVAKERESVLKEASENKSSTVYLKRYPFKDYIHQEGNPCTEYHMYMFKKWFKLKEDIDIILVDKNGHEYLINIG